MRRLLYLLPAVLLAAALAWAFHGTAAVPPVATATRRSPGSTPPPAARPGAVRHRRPPRRPRRPAAARQRLTRAFLDQTTGIPEVVLSADGVAGKLRIRWYKLTSESDSAYWVRQLAARDPAPLAFIGGGTSDRALDLARALAAQTEWHGERPLLLILTATANTIHFDPADLAFDRLIDVYPGRSFRGCFTNEQMADAVVDFLWNQSDLRPAGSPALAPAAVAAAADPWSGLAAAAVAAADPPPVVTAFEWNDDPYSIDLSHQFHKAFHAANRPHVRGETRSIPYSVGGVYRPNRWEAEAADNLLRDLQRPGEFERQVLVLPAGPAQGRRVLRSVVGSLPLAGRNLVAVTGDSVGFNHLYRDGDFAWNVRAVPVPLVVFAHQNPVAWDSETASVAGEQGSREAREKEGGGRVVFFSPAPLLPCSPAPPEWHGRRAAPPRSRAAPDRRGDAGRRVGRRQCRRRGQAAAGARPAVLRRGRRPARRPGRTRDRRPPAVPRPGTPVLAAAQLEVWARAADGWKFLRQLTIDHGRTHRTP